MKKILKLAFVGVIGASLMLAGCSKDFTSDIQNLDSKISALDQKVNDLQKAINDGSVIKDVKTTTDGITIVLSNGQSYNITNGKEGKPGSVITIGENGNWFIDGKDTEKPSQGIQGKQGGPGDPGNSPIVTIGANGNWLIDGADTGMPSQGDNGHSPVVTIGENGNWFIDGVDTQKPSQGPQGVPGNYWKPNTEKNVWEEYDGATNKLTGKTDGTVFPAGTLTAVLDKAKGILEIANAKGADDVVKIDLNTKLTSLVTIPQLYLEGIEAAKYYYAIEVKEQLSNKKVVMDKDDDEAKVADVASTNYVDKTTTPNIVKMSSDSRVSYYANPQNFKQENAKWSFDYKDCATLTRGGSWTPSIKKVAGADSKGEIEVTYSVANPDAMTPKDAGKDVSVISLKGVNKDDSEVNSDFAAIAPYKEALKSFAFKNANDYITVNECPIDLILEEGKGKHLYATIEEAISSPASVPVQYNKGAVNLNEILDIHVLAGDEKKLHTVGEKEVSYSIEELIKKYPDATVSYEPVKYKLGNQTATPEDAFGRIAGEDSFQPQYFIDDHSVDCPEGKETGISAVGRKPIICVKLKYGNDVVLHGYFKIIIKKKVTVSSFDLRDFGTIPFICDTVRNSSTWDDMSDKILEKNLGMDHNMFRNVFTTDSLTYVKNADGTFDECAKVGGEYKYGTLYFHPDWIQGPVNDRFELAVSNPQAKAIRKDKNSTVTLYMRFHERNSEQNFVFIGFKVTIAPNATVNFGEKNPSYWFNHNGGSQNMVAMNVRIPDQWINGATSGDSDPVTEFYKEFEDYFVNNKVKINLVGPSEYTSIWSGLTKNYDFTFSTTQSFDNKLKVTTDGKKLYYGTTSKADSLIATIEPVNNGGVQKQQIVYAQTPAAKRILNLYQYQTNNKDIKDPVAYCNITLDGTYCGTQKPCPENDLRIPFAGNQMNFKVAFVRPVTFTKNDEAVIYDATVSGGYKEIGLLFNGYDWNTVDDPKGHKLFEAVYDPATGALTGFEPCVQVSPINPSLEVNWYSYYIVKSVKFNIDKLQTNQRNASKFEDMFGTNGVNLAAVIHIAKRDNPLVALPNKIDIDYDQNFNNLYDYILYFHNNMGVVKDYQVKVPIDIEYAWGTVSSDILINVKATL